MDPRPVLSLLVVVGLVLLGLVAWFVTWPVSERYLRLVEIAAVEQIGQPVPLDLLAQGPWLLRHRQRRLLSMVGLGVVLGMIGVGEGISRRARHVHGGFLLTSWTAGVVCLPLTLGAIGFTLMAPFPLPLVPTASSLALLVGAMGFLLASGRPYVPA